MSESMQMHIQLDKSQAAKYAFIPGSPDRCKRIAEHLDNSKFVNQNREFTTYEGYLEGEKVLIVSTGIGGPSAAIAVEELSKIGVDTMIRIGTCASLHEDVKKGDIVLPNGVVKMEGTSQHYLPLEFPAVPDYFLLKTLETAAQTLGYDPKIGVNITKDSFYTQMEADTKPVAKELLNKWESYLRGGAQTTSMESATIFSVASSIGIRVATALVSATDVVGAKSQNIYGLDLEQRVIEVAVEAMKQVIRTDK